MHQEEIKSCLPDVHMHKGINTVEFSSVSAKALACNRLIQYQRRISRRIQTNKLVCQRMLIRAAGHSLAQLVIPDKELTAL